MVIVGVSPLTWIKDRPMTLNIRVCLMFSFLFCLFILSACDQKESATYVDPERLSANSKVEQVQPSDDTIRLGVGSIITPKEGYIYYRRLVEYLENQLAMPVAVMDRGTYKEFNDLLSEGGLDVAFVCGGPYVEGKEAFELELLVVPETLSGETVYYSNLIVPHDSPAQSLDDLKDKRFAFTDPQSNSGKLVPTYLLATKGYTPEAFFSELIYTYAHDKSIHAVAEKLVDAASVDSLIYDYMLDKNPEISSKTRVLSRSEPFGIPPVVVRPDIPETLRRRLRTVLLQMDEDPVGRDILKGMQIRRFVESDDSSYDSIRKIRDFTQRTLPK